MSFKKIVVFFLAMSLVAVSWLAVANNFQTDHNTITIEEGYLEAPPYISAVWPQIYYKMYIPKGASETNKVPGVLLLHGYQNDHETCAAYAIELARRGVAVMAIDEYGHGSTKMGLLNRGYVNHKVTVNYGEDSEADGTYSVISGAKRYRLMMNFSNLSFFKDYYSKDSDGNAILDSSCGGSLAYLALASLDYVDNTRLAVSGHSMGTWSSWTVAADYSGSAIEPKAVVLQCGELFTDDCYDNSKIHFNNVLLLQAKYDEFSYFRDYENTVSDDLLKSSLRTEFLGTDAAHAAWNTTFGYFGDGTARRIELLNTNHRLTTHNAHGLSVALDWFQSALGFETNLPSTDQIAMPKEIAVLGAMLMTIAAMLPLCEILLGTKFFASVAQPLPPMSGIMSNRKWWINALITIILAGASYPFMTQLGHGLLPLPEGLFRMTIGNGFVSYYGLLIIIMLVMMIIGLRKAKKNGETDRFYNIGLGTSMEPDKFAWGLAGKSVLLAACLIAYMYVMVLIAKIFFKLDLRFIWPFFKTFTLERFGQFLVYILFYMAFFLLNNSKAIAALRTKYTYEEGAKGFLKCWGWNALVMTGGVILIVLIEYIPFFAGVGPGADLLFGSTFGGPFMSLLILFLPQILVFSAVSTYIYRRVGSVFTGAFVSAMMACWIVTGGSSML